MTGYTQFCAFYFDASRFNNNCSLHAFCCFRRSHAFHLDSLSIDNTLFTIQFLCATTIVCVRFNVSKKNKRLFTLFCSRIYIFWLKRICHDKISSQTLRKYALQLFFSIMVRTFLSFTITHHWYSMFLTSKSLFFWLAYQWIHNVYFDWVIQQLHSFLIFRIDSLCWFDFYLDLCRTDL